MTRRGASARSRIETSKAGDAPDASLFPFELAIAADLSRRLRREMIRHQVTYEEVPARMRAIGVPYPAGNIRNRVARGRFTAV